MGAGLLEVSAKEWVSYVTGGGLPSACPI
jgi:hypothetical protein